MKKIILVFIIISIFSFVIYADNYEGCNGEIINVNFGDNLNDTQECQNKGYEGALFHCCGHSDCKVSNPYPLDEGTYCDINPDKDFGGYACCITTTTTIPPVSEFSSTGIFLMLLSLFIAPAFAYLMLR